MTSATSLLFLVIHFACIRAGNSSETFVKLECKTEYHGVYGQQSIVECIVKPVVEDVTIITVTWKRVGAAAKAAANLLEYHKDKMDAIPGFKFAEPSWNKTNMNVSLLLTNTKMADNGEYECEVETDVGTAKATPNLSVTGYDAHTAFFKLECKTEYHGVYGQQSIVECIVKPVVENVTIITVTWKRVGAAAKAAANLLEYHKDKMDAIPGFKFAEPSWNKTNMNVSLLLTNTKMADNGEYECEVETDVGTAKATPNLSVTGYDAHTAFVKLECKTEYHGVYGQQSIVECIVKPVVENVTIITVTWKRVGAAAKAAANLLEYHKDKMDAIPGFKFAEPSWNKTNMNVSLLLTNTKMADNGEYECEVETDVGTAKATPNLSVTAKYKTPTMSSIPDTNIQENTDVTIFCNSTGGLQKGLIWWFDQSGNNWTRSAELVAKETDDGLFSLASKFTVLKATSSYTNYTCKVLNVNGALEGKASFEIQFVSRDLGRKADNLDSVSTTKWLAPVVVIGSLIVGLLTALLIFRRHSAQRARRQSTLPLMSGHQTDTRHDEDVEAKGLNSDSS